MPCRAGYIHRWVAGPEYPWISRRWRPTVHHLRVALAVRAGGLQQGVCANLLINPRPGRLVLFAPNGTIPPGCRTGRAGSFVELWILFGRVLGRRGSSVD